MQLARVTPTNGYGLFIVTFPEQGNQAAYLNTTDYTLSFREEPSNPNNDTSGDHAE